MTIRWVRLLTIAALLATWATAALADEPVGRRKEKLTVELLAWSPDLSTTIVGASPVLPATAFDMVGALRAQQPKLPEIRAAYSFRGRHSVRVAYTQWHFPGSTRLATPLGFQGTLFTPGSRVNSSLDVNYLRLGYTYRFNSDSHYHIDGLVDLKSFWGNVAVNSGPVQKSLDFAAVVPTLGVAAGYSPDKHVEFYGEASGMPLNDNGYVYEVETGLRAKPADELYATLGYRLLSLRVQDNGDIVRFTLSGPFAALQMNY